MLRKMQICNGRLVENDGPESTVYVYVAPDDTEKRYLVDQLKLDEHTLNSALDPDELSRLEFEPDHVALIFKRPKNYSAADAFLFKVTSTGLFLFKDRLVIVIADDAALFEGKQFFRVQSLPDLLLKLIYRSIYHFVEHLKVINAISGELESHVNTAMENKHLLNLFTLEKSLVYYLNGISSNGVLIEKLKNSAVKIGFDPTNLEFLDDVLIENNQCHGQAEIYSQVLSGLMDARASIVSNNLNLLMKTLNIITIAIMIPTFVVSAFSMNLRLPLESHQLAFWIVMGMAAASEILVIWWWRRNWW